MSFENILIQISDDNVHEILSLPIRESDLMFNRYPEIVEIWRKQFISPKKVG